MSYSTERFDHRIGETVTGAEAIREFISEAWKIRQKIYMASQEILKSETGEEWVNNIIRALLSNLLHDGSERGQFGTPDRDLLKTVVESGNGKKLWVKLLGIKMRILLLVLGDLGNISHTHIRRIQTLDQKFREAFPQKTHTTPSPEPLSP